MNDRRDERLRSDLESMVQLREQSEGLFEFQVGGDQRLPEVYEITMLCRGIRMDLTARSGTRRIDRHQVRLRLGPNYPNQAPNMAWITPVFHPNVYNGTVCLLSKWDSRTSLADVCVALWDMARYHIYNVKSDLDHHAKEWTLEHVAEFPLDPRELRAPSALPNQKAPATSTLSHEEIIGLISLSRTTEAAP